MALELFIITGLRGDTDKTQAELYTSFCTRNLYPLRELIAALNECAVDGPAVIWTSNRRWAIFILILRWARRKNAELTVSLGRSTGALDAWRACSNGKLNEAFIIYAWGSLPKVLEEFVTSLAGAVIIMISAGPNCPPLLSDFLGVMSSGCIRTTDDATSTIKKASTEWSSDFCASSPLRNAYHHSYFFLLCSAFSTGSTSNGY